MTSWQEIWDRKSVEPDSLTLVDVMPLDGWDSGAGYISVEDFRGYAAELAERLGLSDGESVYEVGCGAGALLMAMCERHELVVAGCDFAAGHVRVAAEALPNGSFAHLDARDLPIKPRADVVLSNGVFHYFRDLETAARIVDRMIAKADRAVAVLDVPDEALRAESEAARRSELPPGEYDRLYADLSHLHFPRGWFIEQGARHGWTAVETGSFIPYANAEFRFSAILRPGPP